MSLGHGSSIVRDGLVLHLDAANVKSYPGTGSTWSDLSGNGNSGTLTGGPTYDPLNNGGIVFDGVNDYVQTNDSASLDITGLNITLEVVHKSNLLANATHGDGIISKGNNGANDGVYEILLLPVGSANKAYIRCAGMGIYTPGTILLDLGVTYSITCVVDNGTMKIYVNGVEDGAGQATPNAILASGSPLTLGTRERHKGTDASAFGGTIYSARVYNRALTDAEIKQNFEATRGRYGI
tara:strand:- start:223 stop:936 length:714 start_codon:yes stop_codon:yes gene_type:complete